VKTVFGFCLLAIAKYSIPSCQTVYVSHQAFVSGNNLPTGNATVLGHKRQYI